MAKIFEAEFDLYEEDDYLTPEQRLVRFVECTFIEGRYAERHRLPVLSSETRNMLSLEARAVSSLAIICDALVELTLEGAVVTAKITDVQLPTAGSTVDFNGIASMIEGQHLRELEHPQLQNVTGYIATVDGYNNSAVMTAVTSAGDTCHVNDASVSEICAVAQRIACVLSEGARAEYPIR